MHIYAESNTHKSMSNPHYLHSSLPHDHVSSPQTRNQPNNPSNAHQPRSHPVQPPKPLQQPPHLLVLLLTTLTPRPLLRRTPIPPLTHIIFPICRLVRIPRPLPRHLLLVLFLSVLCALLASRPAQLLIKLYESEIRRDHNECGPWRD